MNPLPLLLLWLIGSGPVLEISPPVCDFGVLENGSRTAEARVTIANRSDRAVEVSLVSTCDCLTPSPVSMRLAAGGSQQVHLIFSALDDRGEPRKQVIVRTDRQDLPSALYEVRGEVRAQTHGGGQASPQGTHYPRSAAR